MKQLTSKIGLNMKRLDSGMNYIWQHKKWPKFTWRDDELLPLLNRLRKAQGFLNGQLSIVGIDDKQSTHGLILGEEATQTSAIEGIKLDAEMVRSSVARHLGLPGAESSQQNREVDGLIEMLLDAMDHYEQPLTEDRLFGWHAALFPLGHSGLHKINVAHWRTKTVYVVSGYMGKEKIHYEGPSASNVKIEMTKFIKWWKSSKPELDGVIRAAVAHVYFVMIHPFEDGNGRIARALTDMALSADDEISKKYYSMSHEIVKRRAAYYKVLERVGKGDLDITEWIVWFVETLTCAVKTASESLDAVLMKIKFWQKHEKADLNQRQRKVINKMLQQEPGGFQGGLTNRKYVGMTKASRATAFREIMDLVVKGILLPNDAKGRNVSYRLNLE